MLALLAGALRARAALGARAAGALGARAAGRALGAALRARAAAGALEALGAVITFFALTHLLTPLTLGFDTTYH